MSVTRVQTVEHVVPGKRLGRHVEHDEQSRSFSIEKKATIMPFSDMRTVAHTRIGGVLNQGEVGSCTGNAAAGAINTVPLHKKGITLKEPDAVKIYSLATHIDGFPGVFPPEDTGSSGLAAAKAAKQLGYIDAYHHAFTIAGALTALQHVPVITGVNWYEGFDTPDDMGLVEIAGQVRGGHEFEILEFQKMDTVDNSIVVAENSWGTGFGLRGKFRFTVKTWKQLLGEQGDVTVLGF